MRVVAFIAIVLITFIVYLLRRAPTIKVPTLCLGDTSAEQPIEYYRLETNYVTTNTGKDLFISDYLLYIIRGTSEKLNLYDGDCVLFDEKIKEVSDGYKLYLVEKYPPFSARRGSIVLEKSEVKQDDTIIGAMIAKIPSGYMQKYRKR